MVTTGFIRQDSGALKNQLLLKEQNLKLLFDLIMTKGEISRAALTSMTGLSPTTVSSLTGELLESGLIIKSGIDKSRAIGRKALLFRVNAKRLQIPTFAFEQFGLRYALYDLAFNELESNYFPIKEGDSDYIKNLPKFVKESSKLLDHSRSGAVCVILPAIVDLKGHKIISTVLNIKTQSDFFESIGEIFKTRPIIVGNESAFYAYAEKEFVIGGEVENLIYVNINVGVGAGLIYQGKIFRGSFGMAGEFGHTSVDMEGPQCVCGNRGCLERLINTTQIVERVKKTKEGELSGEELGALTFDGVARLFLDGDSKVVTVMEEVASIIAFGIKNILRIFDPEVVVIGGGVEIFGPRFLEMVKQELANGGTSLIAIEAEVRYTELTIACKNRGAAKYYTDNLMHIIEQGEEEIIFC
ncbi:MAG: ROK family transcriptional regulator [Sphaerochaetaceae bacterium]